MALLYYDWSNYSTLLWLVRWLYSVPITQKSILCSDWSDDDYVLIGQMTLFCSDWSDYDSTWFWLGQIMVLLCYDWSNYSGWSDDGSNRFWLVRLPYYPLISQLMTLLWLVRWRLYSALIGLLLLSCVMLGSHDTKLRDTSSRLLKIITLHKLSDLSVFAELWHSSTTTSHAPWQGKSPIKALGVELWQ